MAAADLDPSYIRPSRGWSNTRYLRLLHGPPPVMVLDLGGSWMGQIRYNAT